MRDPGRQIDVAGAQVVDDPLEISRRGVAAGDKRHLVRMKVRIAESEIALDMAHEYQRATVRHVVKGGAHRPGVAGAIEYQCRQLSAQQFRDLSNRILAGIYKLVDAEEFSAEVKPLLIDFHHHDIGAGNFGELRGRQADGPRADDERVFASRDSSALGGMSANAEHFHQSQLLKRDTNGFEQFVRRDAELLAHTAINVYAEYLHIRTAITLATATGDTSAAIQIGNDTALIADGVSEFTIGRPNIDDFHRQLVTHNARVS